MQRHEAAPSLLSMALCSFVPSCLGGDRVFPQPARQPILNSAGPGTFKPEDRGNFSTLFPRCQ